MNAEPVPTVEPPPAPVAREPWLTRADIAIGVAVVAVLAVLGVFAGLVWAAISPARAKGFVIAANAVVPGEQENFVATDGRFALIGLLLGIAAALVVWTRPAWRGPVAVFALAVGGFVGALVADVVGNAVGGGRSTGAVNTAITLELQVHARVLLLVQALAGVIVYALLTLFARRDDLGRAASTS